MSAASDNNRKKLITAAAELFAQKGFDAVSTRDLCTRAQVNVAAISYYFGGKEGLYLEVFKRAAERIGEKLHGVLTTHQGKVVDASSLELVLKDLARAIIELRTNEPEVAIVLQKQSLQEIPGLADAFAQLTEPVAVAINSFFQDIQDKKLIREDLNIRSFLTIMIESVWGYFALQERGLALLKDAYRLPAEQDQFVDLLAGIYTRGICGK